MEIFLLFYLKIDDLSIVDFLKCYFMNYAVVTRKARAYISFQDRKTTIFS